MVCEEKRQLLGDSAATVATYQAAVQRLDAEIIAGWTNEFLNQRCKEWELTLGSLIHTEGMAA